MSTYAIILTDLRAINFQGGLMVVICYLSGTKDDTGNMLRLTRACGDGVFPTGVIDSNSERLKNHWSFC